MNKVAIIQARMGSTRLRGKVLKELCGKKVLEHIVLRVKKSKFIDKVVVATTINKEDDDIYKFCQEKNVDCFRGSENNVLERYYKCAKNYNADVIIRITADDPLKDPEVIDRGIQILVENDYDYVSNTIKPTYPEGIDTEIFTFLALEKSYMEASLMSEKEHVTPYIWKNSSKFKLYNFEFERDLSHLRWTMDTYDDFEFIKEVYEELYYKNNMFLMKDVLNLIAKNPEIMQINSGHIRNEGYLKSVKSEVEE